MKKLTLLSLFTTVFIIGCGDSRNPDLSCNVTDSNELGQTEMCVEMTCLGDVETCALVVPAMACEQLIPEGSDATATEVTGCPGDPCHNTVQSAGETISISADYFALNDIGTIVCAAMKAE